MSNYVMCVCGNRITEQEVTIFPIDPDIDALVATGYFCEDCLTVFPTVEVIDRVKKAVGNSE